MATTILQNVAELSKKVDESAYRAGAYISRYNGNSPLSFLSADAKKAIGDKLDRVSANYCKLAVDELAQRMRIVGVSVNDAPDAALWEAWRQSGMIPGASLTTKGALMTGRSALSVWAPKGSTPVIRPESALQTAWESDPVTGRTTAAFKRWRDAESGQMHGVLYLPDLSVMVRSKSTVPEQGFVPADGWEIAGEVENPTGMPCLVPIMNNATLESATWGDSELQPLLSAQDILEKLILDAMTNAESFARPQRIISGLEQLPTDEAGNAVNPFTADLKTWILTEQEAKAVQLPSDFGGYDKLINTVLKIISALSGLPASVVGLSSDNPTSADAIAASGLILTSRAEDRALTHDLGFSQAVSLAVALRDGGSPFDVRGAVVRADSRYSSEAAEADAVTKLYSSGLLSRGAALRRLGYAPHEVAQVEQDIAREAALASLATTPQSVSQGVPTAQAGEVA